LNRGEVSEHWPKGIAEVTGKKMLAAGLNKKAARRRSPQRSRIGRPRKYLRNRNTIPTTPEQLLFRTARELYEIGALSCGEVARKLGIPRHRIYSAAKAEKWVAPKASGNGRNPPIPSPTPAPASDLLRFPTASQKPVRKLPEVEVAEPTKEQKDLLQLALQVIRAAMTVEQVRQLERHEEVLSRYTNLLEIYLDPRRFAEPDLEPEELEQRLTSLQSTAQRMLMPTQHDSLAGAIDTLTRALAKSIELKRSITGMSKLTGKPIVGVSVEVSENQGPKLVDLDALSTDELRIVQRGMELLERNHGDKREVPVPPPPASIDDLLGPEPQAVQDPDARRSSTQSQWPTLPAGGLGSDPKSTR
jgi:hypothetical protein